MKKQNLVRSELLVREEEPGRAQAAKEAVAVADPSLKEANRILDANQLVVEASRAGPRSRSESNTDDSPAHLPFGS